MLCALCQAPTFPRSRGRRGGPVPLPKGHPPPCATGLVRVACRKQEDRERADARRSPPWLAVGAPSWPPLPGRRGHSRPRASARPAGTPCTGVAAWLPCRPRPRSSPKVSTPVIPCAQLTMVPRSLETLATPTLGIDPPPPGAASRNSEVGPAGVTCWSRLADHACPLGWNRASDGSLPPKDRGCP